MQLYILPVLDCLMIHRRPRVSKWRQQMKYPKNGPSRCASAAAKVVMTEKV